MMAERPRPLIDELNAPFWQACAPADPAEQPRLLLQVCAACGGKRCPPAPLCPDCGSSSFSWQAASGRARLWSWNRFHKAYLPGFDPPYVTILVRLAEGPVLVSALTDAEPEELELDQPLELCFREGLPVFRPAKEEPTERSGADGAE